MKRNLPFYHYWLLLAVFALAMACTKSHLPGGDSPENELISFSFKKDKNPDLWNDIQGEIIEDTIFAHTLVGTNLSTLIADFQYNGASVQVENIEQQSGASRQDFSELVKYEVLAENGAHHTYIVKFSDTEIPAIYLFTNGVAVDSKETYVDGQMKITEGLGQEVLFEGEMKIKGRGNSTWNMPKKPYRIKLGQKAPLLEMPENKNWALMANYGDQSLLRNELAFEVSRKVEMEYTPRQKYAEVFLNGQYMGNYNLTEHVKEGKNRVPIDEENGGFIIEEDGYAAQEPFYFITPHGMPITVKFPDDDEITNTQFEYIKNYVTTFESSLLTPQAGEEGKYRQYFDLPSFVNYYLVNEICGNSDMLWSMRMYKKSNKDPKIYVGPVWDFDLGFNNDKRLGDSQEKLMLTNAHEPRVWMNKIMEDPEFKKLVRSKWNAVKSKLQDIPAYVDQTEAKIRYSQIPNFMRWDVLGQNINQSWYTSDAHQDYVDFIRNYLTDRLSWLDGVINGDQFD